MTEPKPAAETELKFSLALADVATFASLPFLAGLANTRTAYWTTYFDTDDFLLRKAGYSLRLRRSAGIVIQTLKGPSEGARSGFFSRAEHEKQVEGNRLDLSAIGAVLPADLQAAVDGRLTPRFDYQVERQAWVVPMPGGAVTVSVDHGIVEVGDHTAVVAEAEFETLSGNLADLVALARQAMDTVALHVEPMTKAERGYFLATGQRNEADPIEGESWNGTLDALRKEAGARLRVTALARRAVVEDGQAEEIHEFRVALRRLRALIDIVATLQPEARLASCGRVARRAFRRLGAVRDLDLVLQALPTAGEDSGVARRRLHEARATALMHARRTASGRGFAAGLFDVLVFASGLDNAANDTVDASDAALHRRLGRLLDRRWQVIHDSKLPGALDEERRHRLRKRLKRFRYTTELSRAVLNVGADDKLAATDRSLRQLQNHLGAINDRATIRIIGRQQLGRSLARTLGLVAHKKADASDLEAADAELRKLADRGPYWR